MPKPGPRREQRRSNESDPNLVATPAAANVAGVATEARASTVRHVVVAADGPVGVEIARQLGARWRVVLLVRSGALPEVVASNGAGANGDAGITVRTADATSRLELERAGASNAYYLIAALADEQANLETCRIAREAFGLTKVIAVCWDPVLTPSFEALGVEVLGASTAVGSMMKSRIEPMTRAAEKVGLGEGEILEVEVLPGSAVVNRPLRTFSPEQWLVAAIYREQQLIVPHGDTMIQPHDRVLLVGNPAIVSLVADYFRVGGAAFPQPYGSRIAAVLPGYPEEAYLAEVAHLVASTGAEGLDLYGLFDNPTWQSAALAAVEQHVPPGRVRWIDGSTSDLGIAVDLLHSQGTGCIVIPDDRGGLADLLGLRQSTIATVLASARCPILIARGSQPYQRVALAATSRRSGVAAAHLAFRFARSFGAEVTGIAVRPPNLVVGEIEDEPDPLETVQTISVAHDVPVAVERRQGNPILELVAAANDFDLLVIGHRPLANSRQWGRSIFSPDVSFEVIRRVKQSVLVLPWRSATS